MQSLALKKDDDIEVRSTMKYLQKQKTGWKDAITVLSENY